jgi:transposase InsO family protein
MNLTDTYYKPFERIHIDLFTIEGKIFLTIIDAFSKFAQAIHVESKTAISTANALISYFASYGVPTAITSDCGTEFENETIKELLEFHKISIHFTTPRNPESNGMIERFHSTIIESIRMLKQNYRESIINLMKYAIIAYNNTIHSVTEFTPLEILFGHARNRDPHDAFYNKLFYQEYVNNHKNMMKRIYDQINARISLDKRKTYEKRLPPPERIKSFQVGNIIYEKNEGRNKTEIRYKGPYVIKKINPDNTAEIDTGQPVYRRVHLRNLRKNVAFVADA